MQKARRSSIYSLQRPTRHSRHSSRKTFQRHSSSTRTFQSFQTFQSFMTFQPSRHYYTFQHFFNQNANSTHRLVSTRNSIEYQSKTIQDILQTYILQRKGDVAISVRMLTLFSRIELIPFPSCLRTILITRMTFTSSLTV